jgi:hypothetical protein
MSDMDNFLLSKFYTGHQESHWSVTNLRLEPRDIAKDNAQEEDNQESQVMEDPSSKSRIESKVMEDLNLKSGIESTDEDLPGKLCSEKPDEEQGASQASQHDPKHAPDGNGLTLAIDAVAAPKTSTH